MIDRDENVRKIRPDIAKAARSVAREWADVIDAEDAEQEIWLRILESSNGYLEEVAGLDQNARIELARMIGHQVAMKYRNDYEYFNGNYYYGTEEVRELLAHASLLNETEEGMQPWEMPESVIRQIIRPESETVSEMVDLAQGLEKLSNRNPRYVDILLARYKDHAPIHGHSEELTRAVDALTREMNNARRSLRAQYQDGPGTRKVMLNSAAQGITSNN